MKLSVLVKLQKQTLEGKKVITLCRTTFQTILHLLKSTSSILYFIFRIARIWVQIKMLWPFEINHALHSRYHRTNRSRTSDNLMHIDHMVLYRHWTVRSSSVLSGRLDLRDRTIRSTLRSLAALSTLFVQLPGTIRSSFELRIECRFFLHIYNFNRNLRIGASSWNS